MRSAICCAGNHDGIGTRSKPVIFGGLCFIIILVGLKYLSMFSEPRKVRSLKYTLRFVARA
jgi:hypothetical protein